MSKLTRAQFTSHKTKAKSRGIDFNLSFEEWSKIWEESGKIEQRGKGIDKYVMSRFNDSGPYSIDNVEIKLFSANVHEAKAGKPRGVSSKSSIKLDPTYKRYATCPKCSFTGNLLSMSSRHFDNCKA